MRLVIVLALLCSGCSTLSMPQFERPSDDPNVIALRCDFYQLDASGMKIPATIRVDFPNRYPSYSSDLACIQQVVAERHEELLTKRQRSVNTIDRIADLTLYGLLIADGAAILSESHVSVLESITFGTAGLKVLSDYLNPSAKFDIYRVGANQSECVVEVGRLYTPYLEEWESQDTSNRIRIIRHARMLTTQIGGWRAGEFGSLSSYDEYLHYRSEEMVLYNLTDGIDAALALIDSADDAYIGLPVAMASTISKIEDSVETGIRANTGSASDLFATLRADAEKIIEARENENKADEAADIVESAGNLTSINSNQNILSSGLAQVDLADAIRVVSKRATKLVEGVAKANQCAPGTP